MAEQNFIGIANEKSGPGFRSHLLMPVVEGNTLENEDVADFLSGRLSSDRDTKDNPDTLRLS
jgi:hypothetical protein